VTGRRWPELARRAAELGLTGDALFSEKPGHLRELARSAVEGGAELLVAVGGDGTINEVANGLVGAEHAELAIIPRGTGGDFVRTFGIPAKLDDAVRVALGDKTRTIDLGHAEYASGRSYFANIASAGMSGAVAKRTNEATRAPLGGKVAYLWSTVAVFAGWKNAEIRVTVDTEVRSGPMFDVIVANCRYLAGGMKITPDADPEDGLFDVLLIGDISKLDLALTMPRIYRGTHLPHPKAELLRGASVTVEAAEPLPVELDGEQPGTTPVRFDVVPRALRLRMP
jgi:YegS/Rv2252/BmrU family lipid kinase